MLIAPYGNELVDRYVSAETLEKELSTTNHLTVTLNGGDLINLANLAGGGYSPLNGFMTENQYKGVIDDCTLPSGQHWTIPILLHVEDHLAEKLEGKEALALKDEAGITVAMIEVASVFRIDPDAYAQKVFATRDDAHPGVKVLGTKSRTCIGGVVRVAEGAIARKRYERRPEETRKILEATGKKNLVAFSTRNICHLGHEHLHTISLEVMDILGVFVITGADVKGNFLPDVIFDTYEHLLERYYPEEKLFLNNLRIPPFFAGPKEAFLQATVLQNHGFNHFIVGRDHAGAGGYYDKYAAQEIFDELSGLDIDIMRVSEQRYCNVCRKITTERSCRHGGDDVDKYNGRDVRRLLAEKEYHELEHFLRPDVQEIIVKLCQTKVDVEGDYSFDERRIFIT